ncbi:MAG: diaminopimelate epimerase [Gammaproteobacteria bacterium]|nr:diaminopimelate epimerase [Gammaproteobacteria bacterium]
MLIDFTKMHGLGNDFVVIDAISQPVSLTADQIRRIADRHFGVGCDQVLLVEAARDANADFRYRIYNADGGEVEQCGNGARCFARFVLDRHLTDKHEIAVKTAGGIIHPRIEADGQVTVDMGVPRFAPAQIPFVADAETDAYTLEVAGQQLTIGAVSMGNPHAVLLADDVTTAPVAALGPLIEKHARFPNRVNVGFMQILDRGHIRLRVYERGAGETLACGTGACAAVAVGRKRGLLDEVVRVDLPGGMLLIRWPGGTAPVSMTGPVAYVFEGNMEL